mgnify:CR=1 FL=1
MMGGVGEGDRGGGMRWAICNAGVSVLVTCLHEWWVVTL